VCEFNKYTKLHSFKRSDQTWLPELNMMTIKLLLTEWKGKALSY